MVIIPFHYPSPSPSKDDQFVVLHTLEITVQVLRTVQTQNGCFWAHPPSPTVNNQFYRVDRYMLTWPNQITAGSIKVLHFFPHHTFPSAEPMHMMICTRALVSELQWFDKHFVVGPQKPRPTDPSSVSCYYQCFHQHFSMLTLTV